MKFVTGLLLKATLSSMILTAPAMINANKKDAVFGASSGRADALTANSSTVIKRFVNYTQLTPRAIFSEAKGQEAEEGNDAANSATTAGGLSREVKMLLNEAEMLYDSMALEQSGLNEEAFEYAWRGYHNLLKRGLISRKNILSICDFSQSSCSKRMYVIDIRNMKLLYRTYVAHGQNSGGEYADSFSNEPESFKSSLGFYVTRRAYYGHNGLSLRIEGVDTGYNDNARTRHIVLHGSSYASNEYMQQFGALGTSLGCPAIPLEMGPRIIRKVKGGSCLFIYHPTKKYLEGSTVING